MGDGTPREILERQLNFYLDNKEKFLKEYENKFLLIHNERLVRAFATRGEAYRCGLAQFKPGTFLLIKCTQGDDEYTVNYRTVHRFSPLSYA